MTTVTEKRVAFGNQQTKLRAIYLLIGLLVVNGLAWIWAFSEFNDNAILMGMAFLAYSFGLRHAVDADHIAAIDNVTRKLMQQGKTPIAVGTFFSLGHSTIVVLASLAIAATAMAFKDDMVWFHETGGLIGTLVSSIFLLGLWDHTTMGLLPKMLLPNIMCHGKNKIPLPYKVMSVL